MANPIHGTVLSRSQLSSPCCHSSIKVNPLRIFIPILIFLILVCRCVLLAGLLPLPTPSWSCDGCLLSYEDSGQAVDVCAADLAVLIQDMTKAFEVVNLPGISKLIQSENGSALLTVLVFTASRSSCRRWGWHLASGCSEQWQIGVPDS